MLNEEMNWTEVGALATPGGGCVRDAFQLAFGDPTKESLPAGMSLYKFNGFSTLGPGTITDATELSSWWSPTYAFKHDAGLAQRMAIAEQNGVSFQEWGRLTSAIKENWSSLKWLLTIELKEPVYAWFGGFKGMSRIDLGQKSQRDPDKEAKGSSANLPGGGTQFYITFRTSRSHTSKKLTRSSRSDGAPSRVAHSAPDSLVSIIAACDRPAGPFNQSEPKPMPIANFFRPPQLLWLRQRTMGKKVFSEGSDSFSRWSQKARLADARPASCIGVIAAGCAANSFKIGRLIAIGRREMRKILSIDAGGVRGIIPATILAEVEARTGQPVCSLFDFFAGTSSGGMLVLALNCPATPGCARPLCSAKEVAGLFHEWGNRAFGDKLSKRVQPVAEVSSDNGVEDMFREYFGDAWLSDSIKPTIVTAFDLTTAQPFFFNSAKAVRNVGDDFLMWQAVRATTAVPPFFSPFRLSIPHIPFRHAREACLVDGSLFASNPAMCALVEGRSLFPGEDDFLLISLGCGEAHHAFLPVALRKKRRRMFDFSTTAQSACIDYQMRAFLPRQRYIRIQADLVPGFDRIDDASEKNLLALQREARETIALHADVLDQLVDLLAPESSMAVA